MSRYIDADNEIAKLQATKQLFELITDDSVDSFIGNKLINYAIRALNNSATVDVEPVRHGHWITCNRLVCNRLFDDNEFFRCSLCLHEVKKKTLYCSNCGAKMDGENENHN